MNKKGFTLIEVVMIIVILGIIMPGIMLYFITGVKDSAIPQKRTTAIFLAEALMEEIKSKRWDENSPIPPGAYTTPLTFEVGETRQIYDDVDDFNGLDNTNPVDSQGNSMTNYSGFRQQVSVCYVPSTNLEDVSSCATATDYKRIEVTITDTTGETIRLISLMTNY